MYSIISCSYQLRLHNVKYSLSIKWNSIGPGCPAHEIVTINGTQTLPGGVGSMWGLVDICVTVKSVQCGICVHYSLLDPSALIVVPTTTCSLENLRLF